MTRGRSTSDLRRAAEIRKASPVRTIRCASIQQVKTADSSRANADVRNFDRREELRRSVRPARRAGRSCDPTMAACTACRPPGPPRPQRGAQGAGMWVGRRSECRVHGTSLRQMGGPHMNSASYGRLFAPRNEATVGSQRSRRCSHTFWIDAFTPPLPSRASLGRTFRRAIDWGQRIPSTAAGVPWRVPGKLISKKKGVRPST